MTDAGLLAAIVGLGALTSYAQTTKMGFSGPIGRAASWLQIPAAIGLLWRVAIDCGWWTIAVFIAVSLVAGIINGLLIRAHNRAALLAVQPIVAILYIAGAVLAFMI